MMNEHDFELPNLAFCKQGYFIVNVRLFLLYRDDGYFDIPVKLYVFPYPQSSRERIA
jgi:hypothetical protein